MEQCRWLQRVPQPLYAARCALAATPLAPTCPHLLVPPCQVLPPPPPGVYGAYAGQQVALSPAELEGERVRLPALPPSFVQTCQCGRVHDAPSVRGLGWACDWLAGCQPLHA